MLDIILENLEKGSVLYFIVKEAIQEAILLGETKSFDFGLLKVDVVDGNIDGASYCEFAFNGQKWVPAFED